MRVVRKMLKVLIFIIVFFIVIILVGLLFINFWPGIGQVPNSKMKSTYSDRTEFFDGEKFTNRTENISQLVSEKDVSGARLTTENIPVIKSENVENGQKGKLFVTWLGHSSILVQLGEMNILIDPVFSEYASPVQFVGPKRFSEVPIDYDDMPLIDVMLISHDHYDHLDYGSIKKLDEKVKHYIVPLGVESYLEGWGVDEKKISNIAWYEDIEIEDITFTATPAQHYTMRNPLKQNVSWWCGYFFKDEYHSVYYSGDGGYSDGFKEIAEKMDQIDLGLIECGQYGKGWPYIHMFPEQTVQAVNDLKPKWTIPVHWGAYCICNNDWDDSIKRFSELATKEGIDYSTPLIGERVDYDYIDQYKDAWWENIE